MPGIPHHVTQRGNRRQQTFFCEYDYQTYIKLMAMSCKAADVKIWAYALMPNHVHLIAVPERTEALTAAVATAHEQYTRLINFRQGWQGHLWQGRYFSVPMDERYTLACARYIELNPVEAGLTKSAVAYRWSSARSHALGLADDLIDLPVLNGWMPDWREFLEGTENEDCIASIRAHTRTGRPLGRFEK